MKKISLFEGDFTTLTPCFAHGYDPDLPHLQGPTLKGSLRRMAAELKLPVPELFGTISTKPAIRGELTIRVTIIKASKDDALPLPHKGYEYASAFTPSAVWRLNILGPEYQQENVTKLVNCWLAFATVGLRKNRAAGSIWPVGGLRQDAWEGLKSNLPNKIIRLIGPPSLGAEYLRGVCSDTKNEKAFARAGYVMGRANPGKESEVIFKVVKFKDSFRLAMMYKNNKELHSQVVDAAKILVSASTVGIRHNSKLIGTWMLEESS